MAKRRAILTGTERGLVALDENPDRYYQALFRVRLTIPDEIIGYVKFVTGNLHDLLEGLLEVGFELRG